MHNRNALNLLVLVLIAGGYGALFFIDVTHHHEYRNSCIFKLVTGIPCPGCGMGRATLALISGNIAASLSYHLLCIPFTCFLLFAVSWLIKDLAQNESSFFSFIKSDLRRSHKAYLAAIILVSWLINIARGV